MGLIREKESKEKIYFNYLFIGIMYYMDNTNRNINSTKKIYFNRSNK